MTQVAIGKTVEDPVRQVIENIDLREDGNVVDVFGPVRVYSEPGDNSIMVELVDGYRRLHVNLGAIEAARLSLNLAKFLLNYLLEQMTVYEKEIKRLESEINERMRLLSTPKLVYAGYDEGAIQRVDNEISKLSSLDQEYERIVTKYNIVGYLVDRLGEAMIALENTYKALHII